jgi:DNA-binding NarL/FixJ family response regulator
MSPERIVCRKIHATLRVRGKELDHKNPIQVAVVDGDEFARAGLCQFLAEVEAVDLVGEADERTALAMVEDKKPRVLLCNIENSPDNAIELCLKLSAALESEAPQVLFMVRDIRDDQLLDCLSANVAGIIRRASARSEIALALSAFEQGDIFVSSSLATQLLRNCTIIPSSGSRGALKISRSLTDREGDVLALIAQGFSNTEIALRLHLSEATIKAYSSHIFEKIGVRDRLQAALMAVGAGLAKPTFGHPPLGFAADAG